MFIVIHENIWWIREIRQLVTALAIAAGILTGTVNVPSVVAAAPVSAAATVSFTAGTA